MNWTTGGRDGMEVPPTPNELHFVTSFKKECEHARFKRCLDVDYCTYV